MYPGLKVTRTIGDLIAHQIGVTSEPNTRVINISSNDKFLVMGTDGLWDFLSPEALVRHLNQMPLG